MVLENATILIGIGLVISWIIFTRISKLTGSLSTLAIGIVTLYYSNTTMTADTTLYGILGIVITITGIIMIIEWIFPQR